jgi:uncharacterized cupredoxin-like copper-binding protein
MKPIVRCVLAAALGAVLVLPAATASAAGDLTSQQPVEIRVLLGNEKDALRFFPDTIRLETGKLYRLVLSNPSPQKHYFSSEGLSQAVFTRKVQINAADGKPIAEVKGAAREIEVHPGGTAEWWFVPLKTGEIDDLKCTIPGHGPGGMVGRIGIK